MPDNPVEERLHSRDPASFSAKVRRWNDTISACERLCSLTIPTMLEGRYGSKDHTSFLPSISEHLLEFFDDRNHPTTSAKCIWALQSAAPVVRRFKVRTHESRDLPFHSINWAAVGVPEDMEVLHNHITKIVEAEVNSLASVEDDGALRMTKSEFQSLHPFTCANVMRAITPFKIGADKAWWTCLVVILWYMNQLAHQRTGQSGTASEDCPPTAYVTSLCVDAVEVAVATWTRRRERLQRIANALEKLDELEDRIAETADVLKALDDKKTRRRTDEKNYTRVTANRKETLLRELQACLTEFDWDSALPGLFARWRNKIFSEGRIDLGVSSADIEAFFAESVQEHIELDTDGLRAKGEGSTEEAMGVCTEYSNLVSAIHRALDKNNQCMDADLAATDAATDSNTWEALPSWVRNKFYWQETIKYLNAANGGAKTKLAQHDEEARRIIEAFWHGHRDALAETEQTIESCRTFIIDVFDIYRGFIPQQRDNKLSASLLLACEKLDGLTHDLKKAVFPAVAWSEYTLNQQLSYYRSQLRSRFDPGELAHSLRIVCRYGDAHDFDTIEAALLALSESQNSDGTWPTTQPFIWHGTGLAGYTESIDTAWALVSTINTIVSNREKFGVSDEQLSRKLSIHLLCLEKSLQWLNANLQFIPLPIAMRRKNQPNDVDQATATAGRSRISQSGTQTKLAGWCSDRLPERGVIHNWSGASAIDFLIDYRALMQQRINAELRRNFLSYAPADLGQIDQVAATDLTKDRFEDRTIASIGSTLSLHKALDRAETSSYFPRTPTADQPSQYSFIFYGPPGTSKTFLAKSIAGELGWPLIAFSPSDFLSDGEARVEAKAKEIFDSLQCGSRVVYFFDEIDELILDRSAQKSAQRSVFTFLTPSFLTKLQDLRDAAKKQQFIFIIGTNYLDRIDSAAKRTGRIDRNYLLLYPDEVSRTGIVLGNMHKWLSKQLEQHGRPSDDDNPHGATTLADVVPATIKGVNVVGILVEGTAVLSFDRINALCKLAWRESRTNESFSRFLKRLQEIGGGNDLEFKPEFRFDEYHKRDGALEEFSSLVKLLHDDERKKAELFSMVKGKSPELCAELRKIFGEKEFDQLVPSSK